MTIAALRVKTAEEHLLALAPNMITQRSNFLQSVICNIHIRAT